MSYKRLQYLLKNTANLLHLKQIHAQGVTLGLLDTDQALSCKLVNSYTKFGKTQQAHKVFDQIQEPDIVSSTALIFLYLHTQYPYKAFSTFSNLIHRGLRPDGFSVVGALSACGQTHDLLLGKVVHAMIFRYELGDHPIVGNILIDMYCRNGKVKTASSVFDRMGRRDMSSWTSLLNGYVLCDQLDSARDLFDKMPERNLISWAAMITGYVRHRLPLQALEVFKQMMAESEKQPTAIMTVAVLSGCTDSGALDHGQTVHGYISKVHLSDDAGVNNALMDMYSKCGCLDLAVKVFNGIIEKDLYAWTTMISVYALHGKGSHALNVFNDMLLSGGTPNDVTVLAILTACSHTGLVDEAKRLFERMIACFGFEPQIVHYGCMVDLLGRSGLLEEAIDFIDKMPIDPDAVIWRSLLGACVVHKNLKLAEIAGEKILELQPNDDGVYVALWNMYYAANRREDAMRIRKMMGDHNVKKTPACSWIEIDRVVHKFVAEDGVHHASTQIFFLLETISDHLKLHLDSSFFEFLET